jgi:hypothetical protein
MKLKTHLTFDNQTPYPDASGLGMFGGVVSKCTVTDNVIKDTLSPTFKIGPADKCSTLDTTTLTRPRRHTLPDVDGALSVMAEPTSTVVTVPSADFPDIASAVKFFYSYPGACAYGGVVSIDTTLLPDPITLAGIHLPTVEFVSAAALQFACDITGFVGVTGTVGDYTVTLNIDNPDLSLFIPGNMVLLPGVMGGSGVNRALCGMYPIVSATSTQLKLKYAYAKSSFPTNIVTSGSCYVLGNSSILDYLEVHTSTLRGVKGFETRSFYAGISKIENLHSIFIRDALDSGSVIEGCNISSVNGVYVNRAKGLQLIKGTMLQDVNFLITNSNYSTGLQVRSGSLLAINGSPYKHVCSYGNAGIGIWAEDGRIVWDDNTVCPVAARDNTGGADFKATATGYIKAIGTTTTSTLFSPNVNTPGNGYIKTI